MAGKKNHGITLVEITISMTIFSILLAISLGLFILILRTQAQANSIRAIQQSMRFSFEEFFREVRLAQGFYDFDAENLTDDPNDPNRQLACSGLPKGFVADKRRNLSTGQVFTIKSFRGEIISYKIKENTPPNGQLILVAWNAGNVCGSGALPTPVVNRLTGTDVTVLEADVWHDAKYDHNRPPGLITLAMRLGNFPLSGNPSLDQNFLASQSVSLRGEIKNFFPEISG